MAILNTMSLRHVSIVDDRLVVLHLVFIFLLGRQPDMAAISGGTRSMVLWNRLFYFGIVPPAEQPYLAATL
ncbi:MAG: hypothetical protein JWM56_841 [Candidatus Peribacteria bacterium]|nr:hypothetical protein [Candidatus Peribacteria bacterium]